MAEFKEESKRSIAKQLNSFLEKAPEDLEGFSFTVTDQTFILEVQEKGKKKKELPAYDD